MKRQARTAQTTADKEIDAAVELADKPPSTLTVRELAVLLKGAKLLIARRRVLLYNGIDSSSRRAALGFRVAARKVHKCVACGRVFDVPSRRVLLTLVPIRPRSRGERRSLRTFPVVTLHPRFPFNV